jgi:hypothetical protein
MSKTTPPPTFLTLRALHLEVAHSAVIASALRCRAEVYRALKETADADALDRAADVLQRRTDEMRAVLSERGEELSMLVGSPKYLQDNVVAARRSAFRVVETPPEPRQRKRKPTTPRKRGST